MLLSLLVFAFLDYFATSLSTMPKREHAPAYLSRLAGAEQMSEAAIRADWLG